MLFGRYFEDTERASEAGAGVNQVIPSTQLRQSERPILPLQHSCCKPHLLLVPCPFPSNPRTLCSTGTKSINHSLSNFVTSYRSWPVPGHEFTTQGKSTVLSVEHQTGDGSSQNVSSCCACYMVVTPRERRTGNANQSPCSYKHNQFHFALLKNNTFSGLFKLCLLNPCSTWRTDLLPKVSQLAGFKLHSSLTTSSHWTRSSHLHRPREDDLSTH